jgi:hypothetical protein
MTLKIILKMVASLIAPFLLGLTAFGLSEAKQVSPVILVPVFLSVLALATARFLSHLKRLSDLRREEACLRYQQQDFRALKELFLARPYEAAQFIEVKQSKKSQQRQLHQARA